MGFKDSLRRYREQAGYAQAKDFSAALDIKYTTYIASMSKAANLNTTFFAVLPPPSM